MKGRTYRYMEHAAQYPFGFGLTYGKGRVVDAKIVESDSDSSKKQVCATSESLSKYEVCATVKNESNVDIEEVLEVYVKKEDSAYDTLHPSLCAFTRVTLPAGEEKKVNVVLPESAFTVVDENGRRFVDGRRFKFYVGFSQPDAKSVELMGSAPVEVEIEV